MDEALDQVAPTCRTTAMRVHAIMAPAATISDEIWRTADGGLVLEYENNMVDREITLMVSCDAGRVHFVAQGDIRRDGIVTAETALTDLAAWLKGGTFPTVGVVLS